jgi:pimeloyl-ACP methyl ester carboxylesterase
MFIKRFVMALAAVLAVMWGLPFLLPITDERVDPSTLAVDGGRFVDVDGISTYVVERGPLDGRPILFLHGLFGSTFTFRNNLDALAEAGFRVIAFDRPGAGLTDKPIDIDYSHEAQADFSAALMDALQIPRAVIVGHSAGGNVLVHFALRHADRVDGLVVVDGAIVGQGGPPPFVGSIIAFPPFTRWGQVLLPSFLTRDRVSGILRSFYADPTVATQESMDGYWRAFQTVGWANGLIGLTRDSGTNKVSDAQLQQLGTYTLLIWGEKDTWAPLSQGERLHELLAQSELAVIPQVGHQPMEESPEMFNTVLMEWLKGKSS